MYYCDIFLSKNFLGGVNPALFALCHMMDLNDFSRCPGVPIVLFTLKPWVTSSFLMV